MLGLVNRVAFELFGLPIYWYAIIIVSGVIIAMWLSTREAVRVGLKPDDVTDFMLIGLPVAIIGARLYYILFDLQYYIDDPSQIFNIRSGGIAIYGALIAGGIWLYFFCQPKFIIDNMYIDEAYRQPTFLYESVWNVIGFIVLIFLRKKTGLLKEGEVFLSYLIWYGFGRFFIEGMRTDSLYLFGGIRVSQALSALLFFGAIALMIWRRKNQTLKDYNRSFGKNQTII